MGEKPDRLDRNGKIRSTNGQKQVKRKRGGTRRGRGRRRKKRPRK